MKEKRQRMSMGWPYSIYDSNFAASIIQAAAVGAATNFPEISAIASVSCRYSPMIVPSQQKYVPYLFQRHLNLKLDSPEYDTQRSYLRPSNHYPSQPFLCHPPPLLGDFSTTPSPRCENLDTSCRCGILNCVSNNKESNSQVPSEEAKSSTFIYPAAIGMDLSSSTPEIAKSNHSFGKTELPYKSLFTP